MGLTPKQKSLLEYIHHSSRKNGYAPSQREIADHFGWRSLGTVQDYLKKLINKGLLRNRWNARRALEVSPSFLKTLTPEYEDTQSIPVIGKIAAGKPIEAVIAADNPSLPVLSSMLPPGEFYVLEVEGKSMIEEGIWPGDQIIVKKQETAEEGETIIALLQNDATVKKLYRHGEKLELKPANRQMKSIWTNANECKIQGVVVGLYRRYN